MKIKKLNRASVVCAMLGALAGTSAALAGDASSVTLYGIIDSGITYVNNSGKGENGGSLFKAGMGGLSPSRWGLRGVEDLGDGKKALFVLESGFDQNTGRSLQGERLFGRQAFVGFQFDGNTISLGRQYTPLFMSMASVLPGAYSGFDVDPPFIAGANLRTDNSVLYQGVFGPVKVALNYGLGGQFGTMTGGSGYGASVEYKNRDFVAALAYDETRSVGRNSSGEYATNRRVSAGLRFQATEDLRFVTGFRYGKAGFAAIPGAKQTRDNLYWFGATYQVNTPLALTAGFYYDDLKSIAGQKGNPQNPWQTSLVGVYSLSKRTDLYAGTIYTKNAALNFMNLDPVPPAPTSYTLARNENSQLGLLTGIRHRF